MADIKDLLDILEQEEQQEVPSTPKPPRQNKDIRRFIRKTGLAPGNNKVPTYIIYYHFIKWCKKYWIKLWGKEEFFRTFKQHFELKRSGHQRYYMINDALDLSDKLYEKAEKYETRWQKRTKST